jgi:hypothetical protein
MASPCCDSCPGPVQRSKTGADTLTILASILGTARRQNQQPIPFLYKLFTTDTPTAQAALYADTA